jgi:hypothetical protein
MKNKPTVATSATIAIQNLDGSFEQIHCKWDGYLEYTGVVLLKYYSKLNDIMNLISLGNLYEIGQVVSPTMAHTFNRPEHGVCIAYGRDKGEPGHEAKKFSNFEDFLLNRANEDYNYLYKVSSASWHVNGEPLTRYVHSDQRPK